MSCQHWALGKGLSCFSPQHPAERPRCLDTVALYREQGANLKRLMTMTLIQESLLAAREPWAEKVTASPMTSSWEGPKKAWWWLKGDRREWDRCQGGIPGCHPTLAPSLLPWSCQKQSSSFINKLLYHGTAIGSWGNFGRCKTGHYIYNWCSMSTVRYCQLYTTLFLHFQILQAPILLLQKNDCNLKENSGMSCQSSL